ncbi:MULTISPECIES: hypothetical protein [Herbaspirillum]|uniref:hypothetical protein n=1 Tax=Herbaspirillum TaxID=963 RepID=UPI002176DD66|nr:MULTISPECIES: hypothetical protein [Herbaspirillum]UWE16024.1 hypothetical protein NY669_23555 [Herbaspirillum huttiense]
MQFIACRATQTVFGTMISSAKTEFTFLNASPQKLDDRPWPNAVVPIGTRGIFMSSR